MRKKVSILLGILLCLVTIMADTDAATAQTKSQAIKTNKDKVITIAVQGKITPAQPSSSYITTWDGKPKMAIGVGGINYNLKIGDKVFGWASTDKATVGVAAEGTGGDRFQSGWLTYTAVGNEAKLLSGKAKGEKGFVVGKVGSHVQLHFEDSILEKLAIGDTIHVKACGVGLEIEGFQGVIVRHISPELLEKMGVTIEGDQLIVPVAMEVPGHIMGSGIGSGFVESLDYDIQTTCPETVEKYGLKRLRLGDVVAIRDHYDFYSTGRYEGAMTVGICIHGWSQLTEHGPGLNPVLTAMPGRIKIKIDPNANTAYYLGIKEKPGQ